MKMSELYNRVLEVLRDDDSVREPGRIARLVVAAIEAEPQSVIQLNPAELQSGLDRVYWAELLIKQLPEDHDGRNSWLLNYGRKEVGGVQP